MRYKVKTNSIPQRLTISVYSIDKLKLKIYDAMDNNLVFLERYVYPQGSDFYEIGLPINGKNTIIEVTQENNEDFRVISIKGGELRLRDMLVNKLSEQFIKYAKYLALNIKTLKTNTIYIDDSGIFRVEIFDDLDYTPARITVGTSLIQISKKHFSDISIPERMFYLLHEYSHNYLNTDPDNEEEADLQGLELYLREGFPVISTINALNRFHPTAVNEKRMYLIDKYLREHIHEVK